MTLMVLVFNRIKIVVEKVYHIDWTARPGDNQSRTFVADNTLAPLGVLSSHKCTRLIISWSYSPIYMITLQYQTLGLLEYMDSVIS